MVLIVLVFRSLVPRRYFHKLTIKLEVVIQYLALVMTHVVEPKIGNVVLLNSELIIYFKFQGVELQAKKVTVRQHTSDVLSIV